MRVKKYLNNNQLHGNIPKELSNLSQLIELLVNFVLDKLHVVKKKVKEIYLPTN